VNQGIHPTAIIEDGAQLAADVIVGAYAFIGPHVTLGSGTVIMHHASVEGNTVMGTGNTVYPYAMIGGRSQDLKFKGGSPGARIGDDNCFREYCTVHTATVEGEPTTVGSHNNFLANTHIAHDCVIGDYVITSNYCGLSGHVHIGSHVIMGGMSGVHQFCRVGDYAMVGGMAKVVRDIPPFMIADGIPAETRTINKIGLERNGFDQEAVAQIRAIFKILYKMDLSREQAADAIEKRPDVESPIVKQLLDFVKNTHRGIA